MESYQRAVPAALRGVVPPAAREATDDPGGFLRRLIPFPGPDALSPQALLPAGGDVGPLSSPVNAMADAAAPDTAPIVSQAAAVLDEEMARGVLAARRSSASAPPGQTDSSAPLLRQAHEFVDTIAAIWPTLQAAPGHGRPEPAPVAADADPLAELRPRATVKPGQRATISMALRNSEGSAVRLMPAATDLLGSGGGLISSSLLEFTPREVSLDPLEQKDLTIAVIVPGDAARGCYSGLLVVRGLDYLRALITIDVE